MNVTPHTLAKHVARLTSATQVAIWAVTTPGMLKRGNPFICTCCDEPIVRKHRYFTATLFWSYAAAVDRQRKREGNYDPFRVNRRTWGKHITGAAIEPTPAAAKEIEVSDKDPLVKHKGKLYLHVKINRVLREAYYLGDRARTASEFEALKPTDEQEKLIKSLLYKRECESRQQQLDKPVICRDYTLTTIRQLRMNGKTYDVRKPWR